MGTHPIFESDFDCLTEMKLNRLILVLGAHAVRHRDKEYSEDETFTYKTEIQNVAEMSGINEYMTMIEEETKAADKTKEINKKKKKKKKKHPKKKKKKKK